MISCEITTLKVNVYTREKATCFELILLLISRQLIKKKSDHASASPGLTECILLDNVVIS